MYDKLIKWLQDMAAGNLKDDDAEIAYQAMLAIEALTKRGAWEGREIPYSPGEEWRCSECGQEPWWCGVTEEVLPEYCPNCGAHMIGKGEKDG